MNLNGDEKRIRQLFRELSHNELERAPEFASVLTAATNSVVRSQKRSRSWKFAMAVSVLFAVLLVTIAIIRQPSKPQPGAAPGQASAPGSQLEEPVIVGPRQLGTTRASAPQKRVAGLRRQRRRSDQTAIAMRSLFAWQSPTAALLKMPDDELLRSLPRLGDSFQTIKSYSPEQFN
jgi:hypothetical protein